MFYCSVLGFIIENFLVPGNMVNRSVTSQCIYCVTMSFHVKSNDSFIINSVFQKEVLFIINHTKFIAYTF